MMKKLHIFGLALISSLAISPANAALVDAPLPDNAYITLNGFDWAWAAALQGSGQTPSSTLDLSYQSQFGWRLPTIDELQQYAPDAIDFVFAGANVPYLAPPPSNTNVGNNIDPASGANFDFTTPSDISLVGDAACATPYFSTIFSSCNWRQGKGNGTYPQLFTEWAGEPGSGSTSEQLVVRVASVVPVPAAVWLFGSGLLGLIGVARRNAFSNKDL